MTFEEEIKKRYIGTRGIEYHESKRAIPDIAYDWIAKLRAEKKNALDGDTWFSEHDMVFLFLEAGLG